MLRSAGSSSSSVAAIAEDSRTQKHWAWCTRTFTMWIGGEHEGPAATGLAVFLVHGLMQAAVAQLFHLYASVPPSPMTENAIPTAPTGVTHGALWLSGFMVRPLLALASDCVAIGGYTKRYHMLYHAACGVFFCILYCVQRLYLLESQHTTGTLILLFMAGTSLSAVQALLDGICVRLTCSKSEKKKVEAEPDFQSADAPRLAAYYAGQQNLLGVTAFMIAFCVGDIIARAVLKNTSGGVQHHQLVGGATLSVGFAAVMLLAARNTLGERTNLSDRIDDHNKLITATPLLAKPNPSSAECCTAVSITAAVPTHYKFMPIAHIAHTTTTVPSASTTSDEVTSTLSPCAAADHMLALHEEDRPVSSVQRRSAAGCNLSPAATTSNTAQRRRKRKSRFASTGPLANLMLPDEEEDENMPKVSRSGCGLIEFNLCVIRRDSRLAMYAAAMSVASVFLAVYCAYAPTWSMMAVVPCVLSLMCVLASFRALPKRAAAKFFLFVFLREALRAVTTPLNEVRGASHVSTDSSITMSVVAGSVIAMAVFAALIGATAGCSRSLFVAIALLEILSAATDLITSNTAAVAQWSMSATVQLVARPASWASSILLLAHVAPGGTESTMCALLATCCGMGAWVGEHFPHTAEDKNAPLLSFLRMTCPLITALLAYTLLPARR